jgi:hypothetical protein
MVEAERPEKYRRNAREIPENADAVGNFGAMAREREPPEAAPSHDGAPAERERRTWL